MAPRSQTPSTPTVRRTEIDVKFGYILFDIHIKFI